MTLAKQGIDVARKVKAIEHLKADLLSTNAQIMQQMLVGDEEDLLCAFSELLLTGYLLAQRCGLDLKKVDRQILEEARSEASSGGNLEKWYGDYTNLVHYFLERSGQIGERKLS
jgi:hypothetical protein